MAQRFIPRDKLHVIPTVPSLGNSNTASPKAHMGNDDHHQNYENFILASNQCLLIDLKHLLLLEIISQGTYSRVYKGMYKSKPVAVKVLKPSSSSSSGPTGQENFMREVILLSKTNHENVVKFIGVIMEPMMAIVTEFVNGGTLENFLSRIRPQRLDLKFALSIGIQISRAIEYLHLNGIIHRDLKPSNILLTEDFRVKVIDFGLAREETKKDMTSGVGSYRWMAPEVCNIYSNDSSDGNTLYDHKADVYSFAMVLWEILVNQIPFKECPPMLAAFAAITKGARPSVEGLPMDLARLLNLCWADNPACRPEFRSISTNLVLLSNSICQKQFMQSNAVNMENSIPEDTIIEASSSNTSGTSLLDKNMKKSSLPKGGVVKNAKKTSKVKNAKLVKFFDRFFKCFRG